MSSTVKYFHSGLAGAPVLSGTAGAMIGVLDACLVNGWGSGTVDSLTVTSGVATVTRGAGHPFEADMVTEIAGATVSGGTINGQFKILSVTATTYTFAAAGIANQTATGTITHKIASLGWTRPYSGTSQAAYRSSDPSGTQFYLRVDDSATGAARVRAHETMSGIADDTRRFPTETQSAGGYWWPKSDAVSAAARGWTLVGDGKVFYLAVHWTSATASTTGLAAVFGDLLAVGPADAFRCFIQGFTANTYSTPGGNSGEFDYVAATTTTCVIARPHTGLGAPTDASRIYPTFTQSAGGHRSGDTNTSHIPFPNPADGGLYVAPYHLAQASTRVLRGRAPGYWAIPQQVGFSTFALRDKVAGVDGLAGRKLMVLNSGAGCYGFDITGPWT